MSARRLGLALFAVFVLFGVAAGQTHRSSRRHKPSQHKHGGDPTKLRSKLHAIREKKNQLRKQLTQTKHQANIVVGDIHEVDSRMETVGALLEQTTDRLDASVEEQKNLGTELVKATQRLAQDKKLVERRLRTMYVTGEKSFLSAMVGTKSIDDLVAEKTLLDLISRRDREMFDNFTRLQKEVKAKKKRQDDLVVEVSQLRAKQSAQKRTLADTREEKAQVLNGLREKQSDLQKQMAQFDADENDINSEIEAYARRARESGHANNLPKFVGRFIRPAQGPITSGFGMRYHPILHYTRIHKGIDFGARYGSPIVAAADGVVIAARYSTSFGNMIIIAHGGNLSTVYAHCSRLYVSSGQTVKRGQRIGAVGNTGLAKGPHLHWEVHVGGTAVNPMGRF